MKQLDAEHLATLKDKHTTYSVLAQLAQRAYADTQAFVATIGKAYHPGATKFNVDLDEGTIAEVAVAEAPKEAAEG